MIIIPKDTEAYEKAERALDIRLKREGKTFTSVLLSTLFLQLNNPNFQLDEREVLGIYEAVENIKADTDEGRKIVADFKDEYISHYISEQAHLESLANYEEVT